MGDLKEKLHEMVELKGKSAIIPPIVGEAIELGRENGIIPLIACKSEGEKLDERMPRLLKPGRESNMDDIDILESIAAKASAVGSWRYEESAVKSDAALLDDCEKGTSQRCKIGTVRVYRAEIVGSMEEATWRQIDAEVSQTIGMQCQIQYQSVNMESRASLDLWPESLSSVDCQDSIPPLVFAASQKPSIFQNLKLTSENTVANQGKERETEDLQTKVELEGHNPIDKRLVGRGVKKKLLHNQLDVVAKMIWQVAKEQFDKSPSTQLGVKANVIKLAQSIWIKEEGMQSIGDRERRPKLMLDVDGMMKFDMLSAGLSRWEREAIKRKAREDEQKKKRTLKREWGKDQEKRFGKAMKWGNLIEDLNKPVERPLSIDAKGAYKKVGQKVRPVNKDTPDPNWPNIGPSAEKFVDDMNKPELSKLRVLTEEQIAAVYASIGSEGFLTETERLYLLGLILKYPNVLAFDDSHLGRLREDIYPPFRWFTVEHTPWNYPPRRLNAMMRDIAITLLKKKLSVGVMEPASSPYGNQWFLIRKKEADLSKPLEKLWRIIINLIPLNRVMMRDAGRPPAVYEFTERYGGSVLNTIFDIHSGFEQIPLAKECRNQTAIHTPLAQLRSTVMPQGGATSPAGFQLRITYALKDTKADAFVDDIGIPGPKTWYNNEMSDIPGVRRTVFEHGQDIVEVLAALIFAGLTISGHKLQTAKSGIVITGIVCDEEGRRPEEKKIKKMLNWPTPKTTTEARGIMGLLNFYRIFVKHYATIARVIYKVMKGGKREKIEWGPEEEAALRELISRIITAPALKTPDCRPEAPPLIASSDASDKAWGGTLEQVDDHGVKHPCMFESGVWTKPEGKYAIYQRETLAVVKLLKKWMHYLYGKRFILQVDSKVLVSIINKGPNDLPSAQMSRWVAYLLLFDFEVVHVDGKKNPADALSRRRPASDDSESDNEDTDEYIDRILFGNAGTVDEQMGELQEEYEDVYVQEELYEGRDLLIARFLATLKRPEGLTDREFKNLWKTASKFFLRKGILYRRPKTLTELPKVVISKTEHKEQLIQEIHKELGHKGWQATFGNLNARYWWAAIEKDVRQHVMTCEACQRWEGQRYTEKPKATWVRALWERIYIDVVFLGTGYNGYTCALIVREGLSGWVEGKMFRGPPDSKKIKDFLYEEIICRYGTPLEGVMDNAREMGAAVKPELTERFGLRKINISAYHSQSNAPVERGHRPLIASLAKMTEGKSGDWPKYFPTALWADRITVKRSTGYTPYYLMFGSECVLPTSLTLTSFLGIAWTEVKSEEELLLARIKQLALHEDELVKAAVELKKKRIEYASKKKFNPKPESRRIKEGDLVLRYNMKNLNTFAKKLDPRWLGPYRVKKILGNGSMYLEELSGVELKGTFPPDQVKRFWEKRYGELDLEGLLGQEGSKNEKIKQLKRGQILKHDTQLLEKTQQPTESQKAF